VRETAVIDSSAVIVLGKCDMLWLLDFAAAERVITPAVAAEVLAGTGEDAAIRLVRGGTLRQTSPVTTHPAVAAHEVDAGEAEVISYTLEQVQSRIAIVDDLPARKCAAAVGAPHVGCVGLAVEAARQRRLDDLTSTLLHFRQAGLYISQRLMEHAIRLGNG